MLLLSQKLVFIENVTLCKYVETLLTNIDHNLAQKCLTRYLSYRK